MWSNFLWIIELSNYELYKCIRLQLPIVSVYHSQNSMQYFLLITWTLHSEYAKQPSFLLFYSSLRTTSATPIKCEEQRKTSYREHSATRRAVHLTDFFGSDANLRPHSKTKKKKKKKGFLVKLNLRLYNVFKNFWFGSLENKEINVRFTKAAVGGYIYPPAWSMHQALGELVQLPSLKKSEGMSHMW